MEADKGNRALIAAETYAARIDAVDAQPRRLPGDGGDGENHEHVPAHQARRCGEVPQPFVEDLGQADGRLSRKRAAPAQLSSLTDVEINRIEELYAETIGKARN